MTDTKPIRITSYRVDPWLNKATNDAMWGVSVKIAGYRDWTRVAEDGKAVIFENRVEAENYIADMKAERDVAGYKIMQGARVA